MQNEKERKKKKETHNIISQNVNTCGLFYYELFESVTAERVAFSFLALDLSPFQS